MSGEIYKQYIFAQPGNKGRVCSWAAKGGWADTVSNRISQIIKITLPLISSDPDSSLFISAVLWWGFNNAGRCQMLEQKGDKKRESLQSIRVTLFGKELHPWRESCPSGSAETCRIHPGFAPTQLKILMGISKPFAARICAFHIHELTSPLSQNQTGWTMQQSTKPCCTFRSSDLTPLSFLGFYFFHQPC